MEQKHNIVKAVIEQRQKLQEERFFIDLSVVEVREHVSIVRKREWLGIALTDSVETIILPSVFDDITFLSNSDYAMVCIDGLWGIFNVNNGQWGVFPVCYKLTVHYDYATIELCTEEGNGLFFLKEDRMVVPPLYNDVTCWADGAYLWVRQGSCFHFVRKTDGLFVSLPDAIKAYDTSQGMFAMTPNRIVFCADDEGLDNTQLLRQVVRRGNGRARLYNYKEHNMDIIDIYGYVLNNL